jgi:hypothetical protein
MPKGIIGEQLTRIMSKCADARHRKDAELQRLWTAAEQWVADDAESYFTQQLDKYDQHRRYL